METTSRYKVTTAIPRYRAFGIRIAEAFIEQVSKTLPYPELELPHRHYDVTETGERNITSSAQREVTVDVNCSYGRSIDLKIQVEDAGPRSMQAVFQATVFIHGARSKWKGAVTENEHGGIVVTNIYQTELMDMS